MLSTGDIYEKLVDEEDARACEDIPEAACRETPRNFSLMLLTHVLTKLGDAIASPKTVLAWVMASVQAPVGLVGLMVPIRESGSLIPQLVIAGWVRRRPIRKWFWIIGALAQGAAVAGMALVALLLEGLAAGLSLLGLLVVFSLARGLSSVSSKDVLGKTVPKRRRGQLTGWAASAAGLISIGIGLTLLVPGMDQAGAVVFAILLGAAALLWLIAAGVYSGIREHRGECEGGRHALAEAFQRLDLLRTDAPFRRFVVARALLLCSALSAPFYVVLGREAIGDETFLLGLFVIAAGLASLVAAPFWGRYADRSSRAVMAAAGAGAATVGLVVFAVDTWWPVLMGNAIFVPAAYFALSVAHDGVRVGRKTYVVDIASGGQRTDYVSVSNSVIGVVLLIAGAASLVASTVGVAATILMLSLMGLAGAAQSRRLEQSKAQLNQDDG